ncbi:zinc finger protein 878-like [Achroia grisella]|uniref:zinc finger protein 878-like n=1 Tax=Achroia grisella TaxID=688607 RepID=UPI0027D25342|nr:zinc finger protein 878-like [Achroia grisella]
MSVFQNQLDFICDYCSRPFTRKNNLRTHIENYHMNSSCYCEICRQRFKSASALHLHFKKGHNRKGETYPECDLCGRIFRRKQNIVSHMYTVHYQGTGPDIHCKFCLKQFNTERNLRRHIAQLHNPSVKYSTCNECNRSFKARNSLIEHIRINHSQEKDVIKCHMCNKAYTNNRNLKRHIEMFHGEKGEYRCSICPKVYTSNQSLRRHLRTAHCVDDQDTVQCTYCEKWIPGKDNLDSHLSFFHKQETCPSECDESKKTDEFICDTCSICYDQESLLRRHVKTKHSFDIFYKYCKMSLLKQAAQKDDDGIKTAFYNCEYCTNTFTSVYELKDHMKVGHEKEYCLCTCNVCFNKFFSKDTMSEHKKTCLPPPNVNSCSHCDKLFTDISSLQFHTRIFHPQAHITDSNITSTNDEEENSYRCEHCNRIYYSDRSLKHHVKLKHTTDEAMQCMYCGKVCSNKYYLASHIKIVHTDNSWSKCDYCEKQFKSKRNIRRHIEYTHLGMQRYKCIECETLFKEKRSLRKHVRTKHPNSAAFPQCHICHKRFESAKSCKIHLKLVHSFNMNTYPCDLCSVSFGSNEALTIHLQTKHLAEDEIYKCEHCNLVFKGQEKFEQHNEHCHVNLVPNLKEKVPPRCIICMKDFSTRKTLKRHIKKFHSEFDIDDLATFGSRHRIFNVECEECIKNFQDDFYYNLYQKLKHLRDSIIFKCESCTSSYNCLEYSIQRYKLNYYDSSKSKMMLSELCTAEMSDEDESNSGVGYSHDLSEGIKINIKVEPSDFLSEGDIKTEPMSP